MSGDDPRAPEEISTTALLERLAGASQSAVDAFRAAALPIEAVVEDLVDGWRQGGRLIYVGAGTSGRIGQLDAAECEPTFGVPRERVRALIAGGDEATGRAMEGAEDDEDGARATIERLRVGAADSVIGLSASGTTPFTCAAIERAAQLGARTTAITGNGASRLAGAARHRIVLEVGDEVIRGSTRLAAGTAQKLVCNAITTAVFIRLGRVRGEIMVAVRPTNAKLRHRATEILVREAGIGPERALALLEAADYDLPCALVMATGDLSVEEARRVLARTGDDVVRALSLARAERA